MTIEFHSLLIISLALFSACTPGLNVDGQVVDEQGNPLTDVSLGTTRAVATQFELDSYGGEQQGILKDGEFDVVCEGCSAVHLFFYKEGYFSESLDLSPFDDRNNLTVVLRKAKHIARLQTFSGNLEQRSDGTEYVLVMATGEPRLQLLSKVQAKKKPPPYIRLRAARDADGNLATVKEGRFDAPVGPAIIDLEPARGDLQPYTPSTPYIALALREMSFVPGGKFTKQFSLEPHTSEQFFYCTVNGNFCKGRMSGPRIDNLSGGRVAVVASVQIYVNPDGTNNLDDPGKF